MTFFADRKTLQRRTDIGLILAFVVFICLPAADSLLRLDRTPKVDENRRLAKRPEFHASLAGIRDAFAGTEAYFNDHFGFRSTLVRLERDLRRKIFPEIRVPYVVMGSGGWLFYGGDLALDILGTRPFSNEELESWRRLLTGRRDWLAERGIRYLFVIPPDKSTVYPEHLPRWATETPRVDRIRQLIEHMRAHSDVPILSLRDAILAAKPRSILYRQTDTHWNDVGALEGCRVMVDAVSALGVAVAPLDPASFQIVREEIPPGDIAKLVSDSAKFPDNGNLAAVAGPALTPFRLRKDNTILGDKVAAGYEPHVSENAAAGGRAVIFHDSFLLQGRKLLGHSFGRVVYFRQLNWEKPFLEQEKPDIVIDEMVERHIGGGNPEEIRKSDEYFRNPQAPPPR